MGGSIKVGGTTVIARLAEIDATRPIHCTRRTLGGRGGIRSGTGSSRSKRWTHSSRQPCWLNMNRVRLRPNSKGGISVPETASRTSAGCPFEACDFIVITRQFHRAFLTRRHSQKYVAASTSRGQESSVNTTVLFLRCESRSCDWGEGIPAPVHWKTGSSSRSVLLEVVATSHGPSSAKESRVRSAHQLALPDSDRMAASSIFSRAGMLETNSARNCLAATSESAQNADSRHGMRPGLCGESYSIRFYRSALTR
jgi:hypothetical protein